MDDHIIRISGWKPEGGYWKVTINRYALAASAGIKKKLAKPLGQHYDEEVVSVPLPRAKKLLKLILQYGHEKDFEACDRYLAQNAKLNKYWKELIG